MIWKSQGLLTTDFPHLYYLWAEAWLWDSLAPFHAVDWLCTCPAWLFILASRLKAQPCSGYCSAPSRPTNLGPTYLPTSAWNISCRWPTSSSVTWEFPFVQGIVSSQGCAFSWVMAHASAWLIQGQQNLVPWPWFRTTLEGHPSTKSPLGPTDAPIATTLSFTVPPLPVLALFTSLNLFFSRAFLRKPSSSQILFLANPS